MKKTIDLMGDKGFPRLKKLFRTMKLTLLIILISAGFVFAGKTYSQTQMLNLKMGKTTVKEALLKIEDQSEFYFMFSSKIIDINREVVVNVENRRIDQVLTALFEGTDVGYTIKDRIIVLTTPEVLSETGLYAFQQNTVSGVVTDKSGTPLPGVSVVVKGTTQGTVSNSDGKYTLTSFPENATLVYSFVGMKKQEISAAGKSVINVTLEEETIGLEEVVAIGYGTQKKNAVTGSVAVAKLDVYRDVPVNNILESVKGTIAGLNVGATNIAGAEAGLSIRGQNSQTAGNSPLIVVDGAIFRGTVSDISPNDIESFTVLKDASAAAVYGSRSANGVILIETKKGTGIDGKPKFEVNTSYGISNELEPLKVYDGPGYIQRLLDIRADNGLEADPAKVSQYLQQEEQKNYEATPDHQPTLPDPYGLFSQMGSSFNSTVSVSNNTDKTSYFISGNLIKQNGVIINDEYKHFSGRVNISSNLTDWFTLGIKSYYSLKDFSGSTIYGQGTSTSGSSPTQFSPYATLKDADGKYLQFPQTTTSFNNPFWQIATEDVDLRNNLNGIVSAVIKVPWVKGLSYNLTWSHTLNWNERNYFNDKNTLDGLSKNGMGSRAYSRSYTSLLDNLIKYNNTFNEKHNVDVTLLYSTEQYKYESVSAYAEGFDSDLGTYKLENGKIQTVDTGGGETKGIGKMARATYTFDNKYSLTGTVRQDGYSAFSKNKKWGTFPSVGVNWNISREGFMDNIGTINNLALRVSYGTNGNQSISPYSTLAKMGSSKYLFYGDPSYSFTQFVSTLANDDLGWESTTGLNLGIDFSILNKRLSGSIDGYKTKTNDLMFTLPLPQASGKNSITSNIGEIQNRGLELNLSSINVDKADFKWYSEFAFSINRNKVETILGEDKDGDGKEDDLISAGYFIGKSLGTIYSYKVIGMWQQEDVDNGTIMTGMKPGTFKLEDVDGDGKITSDKDRQFLGNSNANFRWSLTNTFKYKDLSLLVYLYSIWGGNDYFLSGNNTPYNDGYANRGDLNHPIYDYWTPNNTSAIFPRPNYASVPYRGVKYFDRSFIKLQKMALSYDFTKLVKPWGINGLSCSLSADNLFTYAPHWVGLDPETNSGLNANAIPSIRTYMLTVSLNF
jgi:TonB-dependent starch-binding outer membrane protein SusC